MHSFNMCRCIVLVLIIIIRARESERREPLVQPFVIKLSTDNIPAKFCPLETYLSLEIYAPTVTNLANLKHATLEIIIVHIDIQLRGERRAPQKQNLAQTWSDGPTSPQRAPTVRPPQKQNLASTGKATRLLRYKKETNAVRIDDSPTTNHQKKKKTK